MSFEFLKKAIATGVPIEQVLEELVFMDWLKTECGYLDVRPLGDGRWAGIMELMRHVAIVGGTIGDRFSIDLRYCYHGPAGVKDTKQNAYIRARAFLESWDITKSPEPEGWHRDPYTGRRRTLGDPSTEYVEA